MSEVGQFRRANSDGEFPFAIHAGPRIFTLEYSRSQKRKLGARRSDSRICLRAFAPAMQKAGYGYCSPPRASLFHLDVKE